ncbi:MAG: serine protease [Bacilli bacterium]
MYLDRIKIYNDIEALRNSKVIFYATSDRVNAGTQINPDILDYFLEHLDTFKGVNKISLILYTLGGNTLAAWNIVNLLKEFCNELEIIIPNKCRSAGTLMALGANTIIMTKQATLGPIDPSLTGPLNPIIPGTNPPIKSPVSVESVKGFFALLQEQFGVNNNISKGNAYNKLCDYVNPLLLGDVYRSQKQIKMLATKLLSSHISKKRRVKRIVNFLCSDTGSHDYTISRTEGRHLGLNIESPSEKLYDNLKLLYNDFTDEMEIFTPYDAVKILGNNNSINFSFKRTLLESVEYGQNVYISEGKLSKVTNPQTLKVDIRNDITFEGWRHNNGS